MDNSANEKVFNTLKKLLALAERGVGGEKATAQRMLEDMMKKHGISIDQLVDDQAEDVFFKFRNKHDERLLIQIMLNVTGEDVYSMSRGGRKIKEKCVLATKSQKLEIDMKFRVYRKAIEEELNLLVEAFIRKNKIFAPTSNSNGDEEAPEPTKEEKARAMRVHMMMNSMEETPVHQAIGVEK